MPDGDSKKDDAQIELIPSEQKDEPIPPVVPPQTKAPFHFNQQVNIQQIPPKVWEKLSADQIVDLSKAIISQVEAIDKRQFDVALERAKQGAFTMQCSMGIGGFVAIVGIIAVCYLAANGHALIAGIIGTFLATIIAVVVGNRLLE